MTKSVLTIFPEYSLIPFEMKKIFSQNPKRYSDFHAYHVVSILPYAQYVYPSDAQVNHGERKQDSSLSSIKKVIDIVQER